MIAGALYAAWLGEDANWDWQNYHEYNVWALLHGGYARDVIPPGLQTYFNPYIYFPWYVLRHTLPPVAAAMIMGAVHGLNLALIWWLARIVLGKVANVLTVAAAVILAAFGPQTMSEVGTSFADILTSLPIIAGLAILLASDRPRPSCYLVVGLLFGLAVGFKLTNIVFAVGLGVVALIAVQPSLAILCLAIGGGIGCVISGGPWSLMLWREFGNPFFPLLNGVFPSQDMPAITTIDGQFLPRGFLDALAYPFYWLVGDYRSSEFPFRDARFALLFILLPIALIAAITSRAAIFKRRDLAFLVFIGVSYAVWLALFAIHRYAVALELLAGPAIVLLMVRTAQAVGFTSDGMPTRRSSIAILLVALMAAAWTQPADWWRRPWSNPYRIDIPARLAQPATYFLLDKPLSYLAPALPAGSRLHLIVDIALPIVPGSSFDHRIRAGLKDPLPGGLWEMHIRGRPYREEALWTYGLMIDTSQPCVEIAAPQVGTVNVACPLIARTP